MPDHSLMISRRGLFGLCVFVGCSSARAEPINPGRFKRFVDEGRLDPEIAHVLQVLDSYPAGSWSHDTAEFAYASLTSRVLLGMARAATATTRILPQLLPDHAADVPGLGVAIGRVSSGDFRAFTAHLGAPPSVVNYVVIEDGRVLGGTQPGEGRETLARSLVHELNHVRNGNQIRFMESDTTPAPALFVDLPLARSERGQAVLADFAAELATAHATWRCVKEWDQRWRGTPAPTVVRPLGLYRFALEQADQNRAPGGYLQALRDRGDFGRQVATWMRTMRSFRFVSEGSVNVEVGNLFDTAAGAAEANGFNRPREPIDGGLNYWNPSR
jgi:hypothetical protein